MQHFETKGLNLADYLAAALYLPQLFYQSPETIAGNIEGVVERFAADGLTTGQYLKAALKQPSLFANLPITVASHIEGVVERFATDGLTTGQYLKAALKQPSLFSQSEETVARHIGAVLRLADEGLFIPPSPRNQRSGPSINDSHSLVIEFLLKYPHFMCLADDNFGLREVHQRLTDGPTNTWLLRHPRHAVELELMQHLGHDDPQQPVTTDGFIAGTASPTEEQAKRFVLRALIHAGFIRSGDMER